MSDKWYSKLITSVRKVYSDRIIVSDPDRLGEAEEIREELAADFVLHTYSSEVALRSFIGRNAGKCMVIFNPPGVDYIPYDIDSATEHAAWQLKEVFPGLDADTLRKFPFAYYQKIYDKYRAITGISGEAGGEKTLQLICRWLWGIDINEANNLTGIVALLISIYNDADNVPAAVKERFHYGGSALPEEVWEGAEPFYRWLSAAWSAYLQALAGEESYSVDFSHELLRHRMTGLFNEGLVQKCLKNRIEKSDGLLDKNSWLRAGIIMEKAEDVVPSCLELGEKIRELLSSGGDGKPDWESIAMLWGELAYLKDKAGAEIEFAGELDREITRGFEDFMLSGYNDLFFRVYAGGPVTVNQVMHYVGSCPGEKKAVICFDGMGFQEWYCLKAHLAGRGIGSFDENAVFALVPTITSISRRALFCGKLKMDEHIDEKKGFARQASDWPGGQEKSAKLFMNADGMRCAAYREHDYAGIIFNIFDDYAHRIPPANDSKRHLQQILAAVLDEKELDAIISEFLLNGYRVYITSDHGTVWARGSGYRSDKYLADSRARRALLYTNRLLAEDFAGDRDLIIYENKGIIGDRVAVFPRGRQMFALAGESAVTHGGLHIEEVIIPFVEVLP